MEKKKFKLDRISRNVIKEIENRAERGWAKYGRTMMRKDLSTLDWLQHLKEELLDGAIYIERLKVELKNKLKNG